MVKIKRSSNKKMTFENIVEQLNNNLTASGVPVGYKKLKDCPEVIAAIDTIADLISNMTLYLMENTEEGDQRVVNGLSRKLDINPCRYMNGKNFKKFIVRTLLLEGNAIILPEFNKEGYIENLWPIPGNQTSLILDPDIRKGYSVQINDKVYSPESVIHFILNPSFENPYKGESYRVQLKDVVKNLKAGRETKHNFFDGAKFPSLVVRVDGDDGELQTEEGRQRVSDKYIGSQKNGGLWIVPDTVLDFKQINPLTLKDIAINETIDAEKRVVASLLGIPPFILGVGEFDEKEYNNFIKDRVLSIAKVVEQTLTQAILTSENLYFKFNIRSLYSYDIQTLSNVGAQMFNRGIMTGNEVRDWIGLSPIKGADQLLALENYIPAEDVGKQGKLDVDIED